MNRRGFLKFLGLAPVAAPLAAKEMLSSAELSPSRYESLLRKGFMSANRLRTFELSPGEVIWSGSYPTKELSIPTEAVASHSITLKTSPEFNEQMQATRSRIDGLARAVARHGAPEWLKQRVAHAQPSVSSDVIADDSGLEFINGYPSPTESDSASEPSEGKNQVSPQGDEVNLLVDGVEAIPG